MPRNSSGNYSLPSGNPVVPDTLIETTWANPTMSDIGAEITNSLDRQGRGTMLAALKIFDGTVVAPGLSFNSEASTGLYRPAAHVLGIALAGIAAVLITDADITFHKDVVFDEAVEFIGAATLKLADGTAPLPSLAFHSDPDTGMWWPSDNKLAFSTAGVERARVQNFGVTGLGTLAINSVLDVAPLVVDRNVGSTAPALTAGVVAAFLGNVAAGSPAFISLIGGNAGNVGINLGDTDADSRGYLRYHNTLEQLTFGASAADQMQLTATGLSLGAGASPAIKLHASTATEALARYRFQFANSGVITATQQMPGVELVCNDMNTSNKYTTALKFGSADTAFVTTTPKFGAMIVADATQTYTADTHGGMGLSFWTQPNNPGAAGDLRERLRISDIGAVTINAPDGATSALVVTAIAGGVGINSTQALASDLLWRIWNNDTGLTSRAIMQMITGTAGVGGDPMVMWQISGAQSWAAGIDNSDADRFKISASSTLGTSDALYIDITGTVTIPAPTSGNSLIVQGGSFAIVTNNAAAGTNNQWTLQNSSNTANSGARLLLQTEVSGGDPWLQFNIDGGGTWSIGLDNSDADAFVISESTVLGSSNRLRIDASTNLVSVGVAPGAADDSLAVATTAWVRDNIGFDTRTWAASSPALTSGAARVAPAYAIEVSVICGFVANNGSTTITVNGVNVANCQNGGNGAMGQSIGAVIPAGATWSVSWVNMSTIAGFELR